MEDFHERTLKQQSAVLVHKNGGSDDAGKGDQARLDALLAYGVATFFLKSLPILLKNVMLQSSALKVTGLSLSF